MTSSGNSDHLLESLHAPITPLLRLALAQLRRSNINLALDVACGPGLKSDWLADLVLPGGHVIGVDLNVTALRAAQAARPDTPFTWVAGNALALPLRAGCADLAWCVATLGLFADAALALRELRRVLRPGGTVLIATGAQLWVRARRWPRDLLTPLATAYAHALASGDSPVPPADGLGDDMLMRLAHAGFVSPAVRAFALLPYAEVQEDDGLLTYAAELVLDDWAALRARVAPLLNETDLQRCDTLAAEEIEPEVAPVLLVGMGRA